MNELTDTWHTPLTPLAFLGRSAEVFPDKVAIIYDHRGISYCEFAAEATRLANSLRASGVEPGDRVAYLLPNIPEMLVAHFGVPLAGGALVAIDTQRTPEEVRHICDHSGAKVLVVDAALHPTLAPVADRLPSVKEIVTVVDPGSGEPDPAIGGPLYEELLSRGNDDPLPWRVDDERSAVSINYTSGTTGQPKGAMYHHRGAYLTALGQAVHSRHTPESVHLWTLPMSDCNGWCIIWGVTAVGGTHVCLRTFDPAKVWSLVAGEAVTHLAGDPTVLAAISGAEQAHPLDREIVVTIGGSTPSTALIQGLERLGPRVVHVYGLTETYGAYTVCERQPGWAELDAANRAPRLARQGVGMVTAGAVRVVDRDMNDVPRDGETLGEIVMRGNSVMSGYFGDQEATARAFRGGWFHSGDFGVCHPDGYVELRDRAG